MLHFDQQVRDVASTVTNDRGETVTSGAATTASGDVRALVIPLQNANRLDRPSWSFDGKIYLIK